VRTRNYYVLVVALLEQFYLVVLGFSLVFLFLRKCSFFIRKKVLYLKI